jgi:DNA polymerase-3 subunit gamma/tau
MKASEPVAASEEAIVVTFDYDILCQKAMSDESLRDHVGEYLEKVAGTRMHLQAITSEDWPVMRREFIDQMKEENHSQSEMVEEDQAKTEKEVETDIVEEAVKRFGEEVVQVEDN